LTCHQSPVVAAGVILCDIDSIGLTGIETAAPCVYLLQNAHATGLMCMLVGGVIMVVIMIKNMVYIQVKQQAIKASCAKIMTSLNRSKRQQASATNLLFPLTQAPCSKCTHNRSHNLQSKRHSSLPSHVSQTLHRTGTTCHSKLFNVFTGLRAAARRVMLARIAHCS